MALPDEPPGELEVVEGMPDGAKIPDLEGTPFCLCARLRSRGNV